MKMLECVPNFSEGRDAETIDRIAGAVAAVAGVKLADIHRDPDHHRSVFTLLGAPEAVVEAALAAAGVALERIDMCRHDGVHPCIGAVDVVPFVPLGDTPMAAAVSAAREFGGLLGERHAVPVYFYGEAAMHASRRELPVLRRGGYRGLPDRLADPDGRPDAGPAAYRAACGAAAVGARGVLVAFNVNLRSADLEAARSIARAIRESSGGMKAVRAMGVLLASRNLAQVSMNLTDWRVTSMREVFARIRDLAAERGIDVLESELVGLTPRGAFGGATAEELLLVGFSEAKLIESHLPAGA